MDSHILAKLLKVNVDSVDAGTNRCTYQIWIEDAQSIAAKVQLVQTYNLAGVAAWKLGFENSGIWQVITDNLSGSTAK